MAASMPTAAQAPLMLVTGVSGYIGAHVAHYALAAGFRVRGSVRRVEDTRAGFIRDFTGPTGEKVELVAATLESPEAWRAAVRGCTYVCHVASPVPVQLPADPEAEVIRPAVEGVRNVLNACLAEPSVRRVVLTSSIAAVFDGRTDAGTHTFTDEDWNDLSRCGPYPTSKRLAEEEAWRIVREQPAGRNLELACVNPGFVMGPVLGRHASSSCEAITRLMNREMPLIPDLHFPAVDVRDVALAHIRAVVNPAAAGKRFILVSDDVPLLAMAREFASRFDPLGYNIPATRLPTFLFHAASWFDSALSQVSVLLNPIAFDCTPAKTTLDIAFRPGLQAAIDHAYSMVANGIIVDKSAGKSLSAGADARRWQSPPLPSADELGAVVVAAAAPQ